MAQGGRRKAAQPGNSNRGPLLLALVAVAGAAVTGAALLFGPSADEPAHRRSEPSPSPSASQRPLDLSNLPMARSLACETLDDEELVAALGAEVVDRDDYTSGDTVEIAPGVTDIAHEDGCVFTAGGAEARVWVFAAPMGTPEARRLVTETRGVRGCTFPRDGTGFGTPGLTSVCPVRPRDGEPEAVAATLRGLFGDAWLSCQLSGPSSDGRDSVWQRADRWCVHVATTLGARP
ncbi:MAG: hypothetical protein ACXWXO_10630 [Nocardioides sp.]